MDNSELAKRGHVIFALIVKEMRSICYFNARLTNNLHPLNGLESTAEFLRTQV
jgi:hypothetical protein